MSAFWKRPAAYLNPQVRASMSGLALSDQNMVTAAMNQLQSDLEDGTWERRYADLAEQETVDLGYRLVVCEADPSNQFNDLNR